MIGTVLSMAAGMVHCFQRNSFSLPKRGTSACAILDPATRNARRLTRNAYASPVPAMRQVKHPNSVRLKRQAVA